MVAVNTLDGIKYGFRLLGYLLGVGLIGGFIIGVGAAFGQDNAVLALVSVVVGIAIIYAGALGTLYKVIADGVETGNLAAQNRGGAAQPQRGQPPTGQGPGQQQPRGGQQRGGRQQRGQGRQQGNSGRSQ